MKKTVSMLLCCAILLSFLPVNVMAASPSSGFLNNCSSSYKGGKYYKNLSALDFTGGLASNLVKVANSQLGYHEGSNSSDLSGNSTGTGKYTEYNRNVINLSGPIIKNQCIQKCCHYPKFASLDSKGNETSIQ